MICAVVRVVRSPIHPKNTDGRRYKVRPPVHHPVCKLYGHGRSFGSFRCENEKKHTKNIFFCKIVWQCQNIVVLLQPKAPFRRVTCFFCPLLRCEMWQGFLFARRRNMRKFAKMKENLQKVAKKLAYIKII